MHNFTTPRPPASCRYNYPSPIAKLSLNLNVFHTIMLHVFSGLSLNTANSTLRHAVPRYAALYCAHRTRYFRSILRRLSISPLRIKTAFHNAVS